jgi:hypothetical protein
MNTDALENFLFELLTFIDKKTDWKVNNDTTNQQVITEFLYRNKELAAQFIASDGQPVVDTESGLHLHNVSEAKRKLPMAIVVRRNAKLMDYENFVSWYNETIGNFR